MSKQISAAELGEIVNKLLAGNSGELEHARNFQGFMTDLASLIAQFCGGEVHRPASGTSVSTATTHCLKTVASGPVMTLKARCSRRSSVL